MIVDKLNILSVSKCFVSFEESIICSDWSSVSEYVGDGVDNLALFNAFNFPIVICVCVLRSSGPK